MQSAVVKLELELAQGERLLWAGRPKSGIRFVSADAFLIPFGFAWLAFSIFWMVMALKIPADAANGIANIVFPLAGIPFVLIGLYLALGRFWHDVWKRSQIFYGITNRRVLMVRETKGKEIRGAELQNIESVRTIMAKNGIGTIRMIPHAAERGITFEYIPNVLEVERILNEARMVPGREG